MLSQSFMFKFLRIKTHPGFIYIDFLCDVFNAELAADVLTVADVEKATGLTGI